MTAQAWLNRDHEFPPGRERFRSDRRFQIWAYSASHGQLLLRSTPLYGDEDRPDPETTIDVLFKPIEAIKLRDSFTGLVIRCAEPEEADQVKASLPGVRWEGRHVFMLQSPDQGQSDYVVSMAVGWREGMLPRMQQSFFSSDIVPGDRWTPNPLHGVGAGLNMASARDLLDALRADDHPPRRRERHRYVYVLMTRYSRAERTEVSGAGVFLTEADAEEARALFARKVDDCWIETLPVAM
ncbi:hypothetical protein AB0J86_19550 [Micromonospora sp. NPDC049559]|uniref:hypothetical protein n=1 Tax=Micromonospora sp. NPDC049559 TaxID=3155923 RepID=UPI00342AB29C